MNVLRNEDIRYYRSELIKLLQAFNPGDQFYTHYFHNICSSFTGRDTRPFLRKCLRTLQSLGYLNNHDLGFNIHQWSITPKGTDFVNSFDPLNPKHL